jgi:superfamily II DNA or RNA helicase
MGAEVFSNSLCKVVTPYTLGLSATMERKDGLSKVFKMFLGETIHVEKRDTSEQSVLVKTLQYKVDDDEFNSIKYDFRGNPQYSSMITKLCNYNNRSEFILDYINYTLQENQKQQIMILAHNKSLLKYLYEAIGHRNIANGSVGYYVGGMKEKDLKISETKKVVIATYAMASEGLDIKTLSTLIMATPKSSVEQCIGRILRVKHDRPLVVDIVDQHEFFNRQWMKRKRFYVKEKYKIKRTNSKSYFKDDWVTIFDGKKKKKSYKQKVFKPEDLLKGVCLIDDDD